MTTPRTRSFQLLNHTIKCSYLRRIFDTEKGELMGDCDPDRLLLKVRHTSPSGDPVPCSNIEHSRWHEQVHLMLAFAGRMDLYEDETFVDTMAGYLAQYEATRRVR